MFMVLEGVTTVPEAQILHMCSERAMSAKELSRKCGISIGQCYTLIRNLLQRNMVDIECTMTSDGHTIPLFRKHA